MMDNNEKAPKAINVSSIIQENIKPVLELQLITDKMIRSSINANNYWNDIKDKQKALRSEYKKWLDSEMEKLSPDIQKKLLFLLNQRKDYAELQRQEKENEDGLMTEYYSKVIKEIIDPEIEHLQKLAALAFNNERVEVSLKGKRNKKPLLITSKEIDLLWESPGIAAACIDYLIQKGYCEEVDRNILKLAFYDEGFTRKILFKGKKNLLGTIFFDIKTGKAIKAKQYVIATWIVKYFNALNDQGEVETITYSYAKHLLGKAEEWRRVKNEKSFLLDIKALLRKA